MPRFKCLTHGVELDTASGEINTPKGSWGNLKQCKVLILKPLKAGKYNQCLIEEKK